TVTLGRCLHICILQAWREPDSSFCTTMSALISWGSHLRRPARLECDGILMERSLAHTARDVLARRSRWRGYDRPWTSLNSTSLQSVDSGLVGSRAGFA